MSQSDSFTTVPTSLDGLEQAAKEILEEESVSDQAHRLIREIQKIHIIATMKRQKKMTGYYLPKDVKRELAQRFDYSEKALEKIRERDL